MSLDLPKLCEAIAAPGAVMRVVVAATRGSVPREAGAAMLVWQDGQEGTIGGGTLEWDATARARALLAEGRSELMELPLGPALGQCCGGHVTLALEYWDQAALARVKEPVFARPMGGVSTPPAPVRTAMAKAEAGLLHLPHLEGKWLVESTASTGVPLWIWGAGHVG
ncbi:MAG: XdhC family protein, partial [Pseudomonadota bacterium]